MRTQYLHLDIYINIYINMYIYIHMYVYIFINTPGTQYPLAAVTPNFCRSAITLRCRENSPATSQIGEW